MRGVLSGHPRQARRSAQPLGPMTNAKRLLVAAVALAMMAAIGIGAYFAVYPNRIIVRNSSAYPLSDVLLTVENLDSTWSRSRTATRLLPGESLVVRHGHNDTRATLKFEASGSTHEFTEPYIDLWRGETWVFDIRPDSSVNSRYETNPHGAQPTAPAAGPPAAQSE